MRKSFFNSIVYFIIVVYLSSGILLEFCHTHSLGACSRGQTVLLSNVLAGPLQHKKIADGNYCTACIMQTQRVSTAAVPQFQLSLLLIGAISAELPQSIPGMVDVLSSGERGPPVALA